MPTYTYRCEQCGHKFDVVQRMTEDSLVDCPDCQAASLVKQIQPVGFALKGTGWYVTDFRDKGKAKPSDAGETQSSDKADTKPDAKAETKTETKIETKVETKTEAKPASTSAGD
ncbi:MAG: zinc ribbon domain-containing protein [Gammaproteobacteria bacterium]|nr:zinc ribbon domain-containing protein [Gammaproteobacteria bacterium]